MDPRWTGTWGALATRPPSGENRAQEKSRRSLMFTLMLVRWRVRPICSAMPMNRWEKIPSITGSSFTSPSCGTSSFPISTFKSPSSVTTHVHPGSISTVEIGWMIIAGPSSFCPACRSSASTTGVSRNPPSKYTRRVFTGGAAAPRGRPSLAMLSPRPTARTRTSSTMMLVSRTKPNSRWYSLMKAAPKSSAVRRVITAMSVPWYLRFRKCSTVISSFFSPCSTSRAMAFFSSPARSSSHSPATAGVPQTLAVGACSSCTTSLRPMP
mmetsp:Transcript_52174/g.138137  ORF Transcript_52174/g.138137 Transcript_52174/m.138137 type:complete len:267 (-) Transcript_52174:1589-2389(-)